MIRELSFIDFSNLFPHASDKNLEKYHEPFNKTIQKYNINTPVRIASFCAQLEVESGSLYYVEEIADGSAYEYRKDLGNLAEEALTAAHNKGTTTGKFYKGRGLLQITGFYNYKEVGKALELDLINHPELLKDPLNACLSAGWYWSTHDCNSLADVGLFGKITKVINGGFNGAKERTAAFGRNKKYFGVM